MNIGAYSRPFLGALLGGLICHGAVIYAQNRPSTHANIESVALDRLNGAIVFTIQNSSSNEITAFAVRVLVNGEPSLVFTRDHYLSKETSNFTSRPSRTIMPGQSSVVRMPYNFERGAITVELAALVFSDGSAVGSEEPLDQIFGNRADSRDALASTVPKLRAVVQAGPTPKAVGAIASSLIAPANRSLSRVATLRVELDQIVANAERSPGSLAEVLAKALEFYELQLAAATKHSTRRR